MNHEPLDRLHLQQIAAAYAAGYRMARAELADDTKYYTLNTMLPEIRPWYGRSVGYRGAD